MAKLRKLINEKWLKSEEAPDINRDQFMEAVSKFNGFGKSIYRKEDLKDVAEAVNEIVEASEHVALQETDEWFDRVTVSRDIKKIKESTKHFIKTIKEMHTLQQRLESLYEDVGSGLNKYFDIKEVLEGDYYIEFTNGDRIEVEADSEEEAKDDFLQQQKKSKFTRRLKIKKIFKKR